MVHFWNLPKPSAALVAATSIFVLPRIALAASPQPAPSRHDALTVTQCLGVLNGLNALAYAGEQLGTRTPAPADAKQYKLGALRFRIAEDIVALGPVQDAVQKAGQAVTKEAIAAFPLPDGVKSTLKDGKTPDPAWNAVMQKRQERINADFTKALNAPCDVHPAHINLADLHIGDGPNENAVPVNVLAALVPIIDQK